MLKINKTAEYALIAIKHMSNKKSLCSSNFIASQYNIPKEIMAKTLQKLSRKKYINSIKGPKGGYSINNSIRDINLIEFIEDIEGPVGISKCSTNENCNLIDCCNIKDPINKINTNIKNILSKVKLKDIAF